ncbi:MAG: phosphonate C-P lyase system protein PhnG [Acinetobacter sp.]
MITVPQKDWIRALTAHPEDQLIQLAASLTETANVSMLQLAQAGLGLITLQESALNEPFYLGEFPLSSCSVAVTCADGQKGSGNAQVMADNAELAKALAVLDAILAHQLSGWLQVAQLVEQGTEKRQAQDHIRSSMLLRTRVDFATLDQTENAE